MCLVDIQQNNRTLFKEYKSIDRKCEWDDYIMRGKNIIHILQDQWFITTHYIMLAKCVGSSMETKMVGKNIEK